MVVINSNGKDSLADKNNDDNPNGNKQSTVDTSTVCKGSMIDRFKNVEKSCGNNGSIVHTVVVINPNGSNDNSMVDKRDDDNNSNSRESTVQRIVDSNAVCNEGSIMDGIKNDTPCGSSNNRMVDTIKNGDLNSTIGGINDKKCAVMASKVRTNDDNNCSDKKVEMVHRRSSYNKSDVKRTRFWLRLVSFFAVISLLVLLLNIARNGRIKNSERYKPTRKRRVQEKDLYKLLGVSRTASTKEIKKAYRRKALDTHPDKNKDVPPDIAAEEFQRVVHAFEVLSDATSRRNYDRSGNAGSSTSTNNNYNKNPFGGAHGQRRNRSSSNSGSNNNFKKDWKNRRKAKKLKDKFEVKEAQSRVITVMSMEQLRILMLDDNDLLEKHLLMCFVTPQRIEIIANDKIVFPYPFAGMSSQGIWWEDLLQTVKIRYSNRNPLSEFFNVPYGNQMRQGGKPIFLFCKRGNPLDPNLCTRLATANRETFDGWVWQQMEVDVEFVNHHTHKIEVKWIHGSRATHKFELEPGQSEHHTTMLAHEWWVRDARTDTRDDSPRRTKLSEGSCLFSTKIVSDEPNQKIIIEPKACFDLSGHCRYWKYRKQCEKNRYFMQDQCRLTCNFCTAEDDYKLREKLKTEEKLKRERLDRQKMQEQNEEAKQSSQHPKLEEEEQQDQEQNQYQQNQNHHEEL